MTNRLKLIVTCLLVALALWLAPSSALAAPPTWLNASVGGTLTMSASGAPGWTDPASAGFTANGSTIASPSGNNDYSGPGLVRFNNPVNGTNELHLNEQVVLHTPASAAGTHDSAYIKFRTQTSASIGVMRLGGNEVVFYNTTNGNGQFGNNPWTPPTGVGYTTVAGIYGAGADTTVYCTITDDNNNVLCNFSQVLGSTTGAYVDSPGVVSISASATGGGFVYDSFTLYEGDIHYNTVPGSTNTSLLVSLTAPAVYPSAGSAPTYQIYDIGTGGSTNAYTAQNPNEGTLIATVAASAFPYTITGLTPNTYHGINVVAQVPSGAAGLQNQNQQFNTAAKTKPSPLIAEPVTGTAKLPSSGPTRVIGCVGMSIAFGALQISTLHDELAGNGRTVVISNTAIPGSTIDQWLPSASGSLYPTAKAAWTAALAAHTGAKFDVLFWIGTNSRSEAASAYQANLQTIIAQVLSDFPAAIIHICDDTFYWYGDVGPDITTSPENVALATFNTNAAALVVPKQVYAHNGDMMAYTSQHYEFTPDGTHPINGYPQVAMLLANKIAPEIIDSETIALTPGTATAGSVTSSTAGATATDATGGTTPYSYQWYRSTASGTLGSAVSGKTTLAIADSGLTPATDYYYTVQYTDSESSPVTVSSNQIHVITSAANAAATPTFSPVAGSYTGTQTVTIATSTAGATIYYTLDGSTPTTSSSVYSSAISVASSEVVKAIDVKSGYTNSAVASAAYVISSGGGGGGVNILTLTITHNGSNQPVLTWTADPSATAYKVIRSVDGVTYSVIATVSSSTLTYTDTAEPTGTIHYTIVSEH